MTSTTRRHATAATRTHRSVPGRGHGWPSVAAERLGGYDTRVDGPTGGPEVDDAVTPHGDAAPFGLPVLAELPALAGVLRQLTAADTAMLAAVAQLADLLATDQVEATTGVGIDHWLAAVATQTRMDRRLLVRTCRLLHRLPALDAAVRTGRVSFAQLRGLALALRHAPTELDDDLDRLLTALLDGLDAMERPDPDASRTPPTVGTSRSSRTSTAPAAGSTGRTTRPASRCSMRPRPRPPRCSTTPAVSVRPAPMRSSRAWPTPMPVSTTPTLTTVTPGRRPGGANDSSHPSCSSGSRSPRCSTTGCRPICSPRWSVAVSG